MALSIRNILSEVESGKLRVPEFQRGFVWDNDRVAYLLDSIYKGYPFGSVLLWRTKEKLKHERLLGPYKLPKLDPDYPIDYILDGQQRITSIFGVFQNSLKPEDDDSWTQAFFDLSASGDAQGTSVVHLDDSINYDQVKYFPLKTLFDPQQFYAATRNLPDDIAKQVVQVQAKFLEASIPTQMIATEDRGAVAIVFERVNQRGVELDTLQLLSAWTWSEDFDLQRSFYEASQRFEAAGFGTIGNDLMLRCVAAVVSSDVRPEALISLNGGIVRDRFPEVLNGIKGAIDFLRAEMKVQALKNLPYSISLLPLVPFFACKDGQKLKVSGKQTDQLKKWFWRTCFSRRYNSQAFRAVKRDIDEAIKLRNGQKSRIDDIDTDLNAELFLEAEFRINSVFSKTFVLMLCQFEPRSFISGKKTDLSAVMQKYNRAEFHHIFPKAASGSKGGKYSENCLANIAIISSSDNSQIRAKPPKEYRSMMPSDATKIFAGAILGENAFLSSFDDLVEDRANRLVVAARSLI